MDDIFDYLKWRGDLSFSEIRPGEIDSVIFSMISYLDYDKLCAGEEKTIAQAAVGYCHDGKYDSVNLGFIIPSKKINRVFCKMAETKRFANALISDFVAQTSQEKFYQFGAVSFHLPGKIIMISFRGTDDTIAGWHEDCCLAFLDEIPAQRMAVEYVEMIAAKYPDRKIYITGHSKGGNLSAYALINCSDEARERVVRAFCLDGPGLSYSMINSEKYKKARKKLTVLLPQSSFVGTMFEKGEKYTVIYSSAKGLFQHDPFSWELDGPGFIKLPELSSRGKKNEEQFRATMHSMSSQEKKEFVDNMFSLVASTGAVTLTDFTEGGIKNLRALAKSYGGMNKTERELMLTIFLKLFDVKKEKTEEIIKK